MNPRLDYSNPTYLTENRGGHNSQETLAASIRSLNSANNLPQRTERQHYFLLTLSYDIFDFTS